MNKKLNLIRAFAILIVMLGHAIIIYDPRWKIINTDIEAPGFVALKSCINVIQMPLFFALSGYLLVYGLKKNHGHLLWLRKKGIRFLAPFFLIGVFYMLPIKILLQVPYHQVDSWEKLWLKLKMFMLGGATVGHLWFLPTLFFIMLLSKLLLREKKCVWQDAIFVLLTFGLPFLSKSIGNTVPYVANVCKFMPFFVLGFMMSKYQLDTLKWYKLPLIVLPLWFCLPSGIGVNLALSLSFVYLIFRFFPIGSLSGFGQFPKNSFGLYLFHSPLIYFAFMLCPDVYPIWMFIINFVICALIAWGLTAAARKYRITRYAIGE